MRISPTTTTPAAAEHGVTLLECLVYISLLAVVLGIGTMAFWRCWDGNKALHRNADDIVRALHAGEQWRADVRAATGPIQRENAGDNECFLIPSPKGEIVYRVVEGNLRRQGPGADAVLLTEIQSSQMQLDPRQHVTACRWELELRTGRKSAAVRPLFVFEAVPGASIVR